MKKDNSGFDSVMTRLDRPWRLCAALALAGAALANPAWAATTSDTMTVTATVVAACSVNANDLAFNTYNPVTGSPVNQSTTIEVTCTNGAAYVVSVNAGSGTGASVATRKMTSGANTLNYSLYRDTNHTLVWGVSSGVDTVAGTGSGALQTLTIYGQIPGSQTSPAGSYTDTVTVTVTY